MIAEEESFDSIHSLLTGGQADHVRQRLIDPRTRRLRRPYARDRNHAWYCLGSAEFKLENFKEAVAAYKRAYKADVLDAQSLLAIGNCYNAMKQPKLAERFFRKGLEIESLSGKDRAALSVNLGNALLDQGRSLEAAAAYFPVRTRRDQIGRKARLNFKKASEMASRRRGR